MVYVIRDCNGNLLYNDKKMTSYTPYPSLTRASKVLKKLPENYYITESNSKKKVEPK